MHYALLDKLINEPHIGIGVLILENEAQYCTSNHHFLYVQKHFDIIDHCKDNIEDKDVGRQIAKYHDKTQHCEKKSKDVIYKGLDNCSANFRRTSLSVDGN
ncbi:hypothetical protein RCL_jg4907.t1 [Rhizophagus clarus]|uniref:Uncharacterized protein n=1 Tax=Rhizophagus clarus TaxID=94130 RepID=A0A8H3QMQ7_9GLOM|nr:hypothetical protein RCL_jg4907.t1 [Rhizophagus clarus]